MLVRVTVENFKSFDKKAELSMVASSKVEGHPDHVATIRGAKILKHAAIYGANASGKSNLIAAIRFLQQTLQNGLSLSSSRLYCRSSDENAHRESTFEVQFALGDEVYAYGFSALLSKREITGEWLYDIGPTPARCLMERTATRNGRSIFYATDTSLNLDGADKQRFETYAEDFSENASSLFLAELNRSKRHLSSSRLSVFKRAYDWLVRRMAIFSSMQPLPSPSYLFKEDQREVVSQIISSFDTGVSVVEVDTLSPEELYELVPTHALRAMLEDSERRLNAGEADRVGLTYRGPDNLVAVEFTPDGEYEAIAVRLRHSSSRSVFDFGEESEGTQRLFDLIFMLVNSSDDVTYVIDELDRSLHPMLVRRFLELFMEQGLAGRKQLIFSSHESSVMDQELFRRDEIWFVDRDQKGNSSLYSLDRFKERYDSVVSKAYLEGRYGAVPAFSRIDHATKSGE